MPPKQVLQNALPGTRPSDRRAADLERTIQAATVLGSLRGIPSLDAERHKEEVKRLQEATRELIISVYGPPLEEELETADHLSDLYKRVSAEMKLLEELRELERQLEEENPELQKILQKAVQAKQALRRTRKVLSKSLTKKKPTKSKSKTTKKSKKSKPKRTTQKSAKKRRGAGRLLLE